MCVCVYAWKLYTINLGRKKRIDYIAIYVGSIPGLGSQSTVFQDRLGSTKLGVARVDLVISNTLQGSSFSMYTHKPVWIYRDERKFEFFLSIVCQINLAIHYCYLVVYNKNLYHESYNIRDLLVLFQNY